MTVLPRRQSFVHKRPIVLEAMAEVALDGHPRVLGIQVWHLYAYEHPQEG